MFLKKTYLILFILAFTAHQASAMAGAGRGAGSKAPIGRGIHRGALAGRDKKVPGLGGSPLTKKDAADKAIADAIAANESLRPKPWSIVGANPLTFSIPYCIFHNDDTFSEIATIEYTLSNAENKYNKLKIDRLYQEFKMTADSDFILYAQTKHGLINLKKHSWLKVTSSREDQLVFYLKPKPDTP